ncbi:MAG: hypothetical protein Kow0074_23430 [Candidatus Zixiibacteriota bacterium]
MTAHTCSRLQISTVVAGIVVVVLLPPPVVHAQSPIVVGAEIGAGHYPLDKWSDFSEGILHSHYSKERISPNWKLFIGYDVSSDHTVKLTVGHHSVQPTIASAVSEPDHATSTDLVYAVEWDLSATPVGLAYEFTPALTRTADLLMGFEAAYYWSKVDVDQHWIFDPDSVQLQFDPVNSRKEKGFGFTLYLGARAPITERIALCPMVRARYADGSDFTEEDRSVPIEFTGLDAALGLEIRPF